MHRIAALALAAVLLAACSEEAPARPSAPAPAEAPADAPEAPSSELARTTAPGFDLPPPPGGELRHAQAHAANAQALFTTERAPEEVVSLYTRELLGRGLRLEPLVESRSREPARFREVLNGWGEDDGAMAAVRVTIERGPSGLTRVSLSQRRPYAPDFDSGREPRAWCIIARAPLPAPSGEAVVECTQAVLRACDAWAAASGIDALSCAMDHRGPCVRTDEPIYLARAVVDARERLIAALRAHDSVATSGAREETQAQLRLERTGAAAVLHRATGRLDEAGTAELGALAELLDALPIEADAQARPAEWFTAPEP